ncbi:MAG TPA: hypothetical protein PKW97_12285 [Syntrophorhabdus sp.]|jgi:hypothetical protein|nr:hypothetical protein [Pseudomonadota bacterium]HNY71417.1 hypothetical protein [Syntrophorhabdus sp.]HOD77753.1 hypothetical protein [Syntrophorhabdus sp.]HQG25270.1 hypothetical protein [Syntrophorhabdus sp.]HQH81992.1 hypothetical protein [Syntrophorhabdus sp.]
MILGSFVDKTSSVTNMLVIHWNNNTIVLSVAAGAIIAGSK